MKDEQTDKTGSESAFEFTYAGARYRFVKPDIIQRSFYMIRNNHVFYEHEMLKDMQGRLKRGELVMDIGANIGNHTIFLAGVCNCDVIALEPFPKSFELLTRNVDINSLGNRVTAINMAAGAKAGYGDVCLPRTANHGEVAIKQTTAKAGIRIIPLDDLELPRQPRMLKIDVEGSEIEVLRGAESLISSARPLIYVETLNEEAFDEVCAFLNNMQYRTLRFFKPATFLFACTEESVLASQGYDPGSQLGRLCLHYRVERDKANSKVRQLKDTGWKRFRKRIKVKAREIGATLGRRFHGTL